MMAETAGVVIGNHTPKYTARNPAIRWLTQRWVANLDCDDPGRGGRGEV